MPSWIITYSRPLAPPSSIDLLISREHGCMLQLSGPIFGINIPDNSEIGQYTHNIPETKADSLKKLAESAIKKAESMKGSVYPRGTRFLEFGIGTTGDKLISASSVPLRSDLPDEIRKLDDAMIEIAREILKFPDITLSGKAECVTKGVKIKHTLNIRLKLYNSGTQQIVIHNPAVKSDILNLFIERKGSNGYEDQEYLTVKTNEVSFPDEPEKKTAPLISLEPKQEITMNLRVFRNLYFGKGMYSVHVNYLSVLIGIPEQKSVAGRLVIPAGEFKVE